MKMRAAVLYELALPKPYIDSRPFIIEDIDIDGPQDAEVLVEIRAAGLCHSDLSVVAGLRKRMLPAIGGHEGAGIVREVGPDVKHLRPGDHVVMTVGAGCGHCNTCSRGRPVLCEGVQASRAQGRLPSGGIRLSYRGQPMHHYSGISSFAQFAVTDATSLVKIDKAVPFDIAAMFGCAVVTGIGCVTNAAQLQAGQTVAVIGLGGVGLNTVMAAKMLNASKIIGIDIDDRKFPLAMELGCTQTLSACDPGVVEAVRDLTGGGVDFSFEISGNETAMSMAYAVTRKGGEIIAVGLGAAGNTYGYPHTALVTEEKVLRGSALGSGIAGQDIPRYVDMYLAGKLPLERLKSSNIEFDILNESLDRLDRGDVVRQILLPHG